MQYRVSYRRVAFSGRRAGPAPDRFQTAARYQATSYQASPYQAGTFG
ncbi:hypothetical protein HMPREF0762_01700 [Slackia exigua ATCC 700122]|uniref:Uncharacterized protein n=1 Tax=Slackia exigua (strain ATCC 700122 / DSM 15923 / CIP 105133 / JCM 11022 / KCTC 5966 / S-7) TaxID=649764 RepID=D0WIM5_SLAES|nr:hypothetical protein HMPREF0762_01700 [Slackia exigua ATCC 700122]